MRCWALSGPRWIELLDVPVPEPAPNEVLVRVGACGICNRTDLMAYLGHRLDFIRRTVGEEAAIADAQHFGHEVAGIVEKAGSGVGHLREGDRVFCRSRHGTPSGFAEYALVAEHAVAMLPGLVAMEHAPVAQNIPIVLNGLRALHPGDTLFVSGLGPQGLLHVLLGRHLGAGTVVGADRHANRLRAARELGADAVVNIADGDPVRVAREIVPVGYDYVVEAVGTDASLKNCLNLARRGGTMEIYGTHLDFVSLDLYQWERLGLTVVMANETTPEATRRLMERARKLLGAGAVDPARFVTHTFPLEQLPAALDLLEQHPEQVIKISVII